MSLGQLTWKEARAPGWRGVSRRVVRHESGGVGKGAHCSAPLAMENILNFIPRAMRSSWQ